MLYLWWKAVLIFVMNSLLTGLTKTWYTKIVVKFHKLNAFYKLYKTLDPGKEKCYMSRSLPIFCKNQPILCEINANRTLEIVIK